MIFILLTTWPTLADVRFSCRMAVGAGLATGKRHVSQRRANSAKIQPLDLAICQPIPDGPLFYVWNGNLKEELILVVRISFWKDHNCQAGYRKVWGRMNLPRSMVIRTAITKPDRPAIPLRCSQLQINKCRAAKI